MPTVIASTINMLIDSPTDIQVTEMTTNNKFGISFRTPAFASDMSVITFSGSPADLKATFSQAIDLLDRKFADDPE